MILSCSILKRHYEFWFSIIALHKIGAIAIPATHLLSKKDIVYRNNAVDIKMIVSVGEDGIMSRIDESLDESPTLKIRVCVGAERKGWNNFGTGLSKSSPQFKRPEGDESSVNSDIMLLYFTSGTTGMPKMVKHDYTYPLGHIVTAQYWQNVDPEGIHLTVSDTGWAKSVWGKLYGQWISGTAIFVYEYERFVPREMLDIITRNKITTFCAPPTIYRYLIKEKISDYDFSNMKYCAVAGEPLNPEVYTQWLSATGIRLMEGYGQTEAVVMVATYPWLEPKPGSMGKPTPGYDIQILKDDLSPCEIGEEGQIAVRVDKKIPLGLFNG